MSVASNELTKALIPKNVSATQLLIIDINQYCQQKNDTFQSIFNISLIMQCMPDILLKSRMSYNDIKTHKIMASWLTYMRQLIQLSRPF